MRKIVLFFLLFYASFNYSYSQELPHIKHVRLNKSVHFKNTEQLTLKVIAYLFATPIDKKNKSRREAGQFIIQWMNGTPYYNFHLEDKETSFFNTDSDLMLMYMAALTKFTLENPSLKDQKTLILGAMSLTLPYLAAQDDKRNWSRELWQLNDANQKGKLEEYLYP